MTLLLILPAHARAERKEIKNIVVIGWDAAERSRTRELLEKGELPNLAALIREGKLLDIDVVSGATDTKAGWTQLLTGYVPEKTGVYNNGRYEPIPEGYTVFERLEKFFGPDQIDTVAIIGKKSHVDNDAPYRGTFEEWTKLVSTRLGKVKKNPQCQDRDLNRRSTRKAAGSSKRTAGGSSRSPASRGIAPASISTCGSTVWKRTKKWPSGPSRNWKSARITASSFSSTLPSPITADTQFGENSQEYADGFKLDDQYSGWIINKLKALGLYEKTLVYVIADHGFDKDKKTHLYAPFVFAGTNDPTVARSEGTREDIAPTILKKFGLDLSKIEPQTGWISVRHAGTHAQSEPRTDPRIPPQV